MENLCQGKPKTIYYRCFINSEQNKFNEELKKKVSIDLSFEAFLEIFQSTLDRFAPYKQIKVRYNNNLFMTKQLRKKDPNYEMNLINLERQKAGKNINNKETNVSPF